MGGMKCRMERLVKMKTEDELMLGFTKRKKQIDEKRKARNKFIAIISATLVFVMLTSAVALTVSAHRKTDVAIISGIGAEHTACFAGHKSRQANKIRLCGMCKIPVRRAE